MRSMTAGTSFRVHLRHEILEDRSTPASTLLGVSGLPNGTAQIFIPNLAGTYAPGPVVGSPVPIDTNIRTAIADVNNDGFEDTIGVSGPGVATRFVVISGADGSVLVGPTAPFVGSEDFSGGGFAAAGDFNGDGRDEIVITPDQGGGPRVSIFSFNPDGSLSLRANFFGITDDPNFRGGVRPAVGDVNHDFVPDIAVAAGFLGGPRVALFNGLSLFVLPAKLTNDFFAFPEDASTLRNGAFVALGDVNGDGFADAIFGGGPGGAPRVFILSGSLLSAGNFDGAYASPIANFFVAGNSTDRGGVRVAAKNADGDFREDVVVGSGEGSPARVRVYLGRNFTGTTEPANAQEITVAGGDTLANGIFVG